METDGAPGNCDAPVVDGGHNIDSGTTCGFKGVGCPDTSGTSFCNTDPLLNPAGLANNGGPTQTIALLPQSPAVDTGFNVVCMSAAINNVDQRGVIRITASDPICDIGAFELKPSDLQQSAARAPAVSRMGLLGLFLLLSAVGWFRLRSR